MGRLRYPWARGADSADRWLTAVGVAYSLVQLAVVRPTLALSWDETVYVSQISRSVPAAFFSAPRARGISMLVAPVAAMTISPLALRTYLAVLSGTALVVAFWPWLRLTTRRCVVPVAAALFAGLWVTVFYGPAVMPNLWVAFGCVFAVGWFARHVAESGTSAESGYRPLLGVASGLGFVALMRPGDAFWLAIALFAAAAMVRAWRSWPLLAAMAGGLLAGGAEWLIEAQVRYGGVVARLQKSSQIEGGMGWHPVGVLMQLRAVDGKTLCRPCQGHTLYHPIFAVWWVAVPVVALIGVVAAIRVSRAAPVALAAACGVSVAVPYLLMLDYAAPRFLLPAYGLLAICVAEALVVSTAVIGRMQLRKVAFALLGVAVTGHLIVQAAVLHRVIGNARATSRTYAHLASELHAFGIRPPCAISGESAPPVAFYARCSSQATNGNNTSITPAGLNALAHTRPVAFIEHDHARPPSYARSWQALPMHSAPGWVAYLSTRPRRKVVTSAAVSVIRSDGLWVRGTH